MLPQRISHAVLVATLRSVAQTWQYHPYRLPPLLGILHQAQNDLRQTDIATKLARLEDDIWAFHFTTEVTGERVVALLRQLLQIFDTTTPSEMDALKRVGTEVVHLMPIRGE